MPEPLAETFTFASGEKRYVMFLRFDVRNYPRFLKYLKETLGVEMGSVKNMVFAKASDFKLGGIGYTAVAGDSDDCHVVASNEAARIALLAKIFGPNHQSERHTKAY